MLVVYDLLFAFIEMRARSRKSKGSKRERSRTIGYRGGYIVGARFYFSYSATKYNKSGHLWKN